MADNLSKAGWSLGWVSTLDLQGRTIWIVDAHCYGKRFIMRAEEILTAFLELERAVSIPSLRLPKRIGLRSDRRLSEVLVKFP